MIPPAALTAARNSACAAAASGSRRVHVVAGWEVALQELLSALPRPGRRVGHVEHRGLAVVERVPGFLLDVDLDVRLAGCGRFDAGYLVARNVRVVAAVLELHRGGDLVEDLEAFLDARAVVRHQRGDLGLAGDEVGDRATQAE